MIRKKRGAKKGQITLFIILGIVLIFSTAIIIFIRTQAKEEMPLIPEVTESLPVAVQPVKDYIEDCIYITSKEAIEMIGTHGGYIGLGPQYARYTSKAMRIDPAGTDPTSYDALTVSPEWQVPYWNYMTSPNDCTAACQFGSERPPLLKTQGPNSIEEQIDNYVKANLDECLGDFSDFNDRGFFVEKKGNISMRTVITDNNVIVFVEYPFEVTFGDTTADMSQYLVTLNVNLKDIYNLASEITTLAVNNKFLEQHALNLIAGYSGIDENALPPMAGTDFSFASKTWSKAEVTKKLQDILAIYVNALQATKTSNFRLNYLPDNEFKTGLYSQMVLPLEDSHYDTSVDFNYLGWPIYFYITSGEVIRAREGVAVPLLSLLIPFQRYDLPYDVSFPVMVEMRDNVAFGGEGYSFFIGLEANIRNNKPVTEDFVAFEQESDVTAQMQLCNENQRVSGDVTITTSDTQNNPLPGAMIYFSVGDVMCPIGETTLNEEGTIASYTGKFPLGAIGTLVVMHPDTAPYSQEFFRAKETPEVLDNIKLERYVSLNATAMKMNIDKQGNEWGIDPTLHGLADNEEAVVMLTKVKEKATEPDVVASVDVKAGEKGELRLVPGKYKATVTLLRDDSTITIPSRTVSGQKIPEFKVVENGVFPTTYEAYFIFGNDIYTTSNVRFNALSFNIFDVPENQRTIDDITAWGNTTQYATDNIYYLSPVLS